MKTFVVCLALIVSAFQLQAYPISPRPLRQLVLESEFIIIGYVTGIKKNRSNDNTFDNDAFAVLKVNQILKGEVPDEVIEIAFSPNMICPAPPHYVAGTTVIVFLTKHKKVFHTTALSYGMRIVGWQDIEVYKNRIAEIQAIQKMEEGLDKFMQTVEWLVKCAENKSTRWDGSYELSPESDFMSYYSRTQFEPFSSMLSQEQKSRLKKALLEDNDEIHIDFGLVDIVYVGNEKEIHSLLLNALKKLTENQLYFADNYMDRLLLLTNDPELIKLRDAFQEIQFERNKGNEQVKLVNTFIARLEK
jgi:hypothetical protein